MIFLLPTRSTRRYRGKHPERVNMWSYSRSACQMAIADYLGISRPVHIELNDGRRYIADMKSLRPEGVKLGVELISCLHPDVMFVESAWEDLSQERYDEMLERVRAARNPKQSDDAPLAVVA